MTIGAHELELIKREVAGIRDFYNARMNSEIPPLREEVDRIASLVGRIQDTWREGEKRAILARFSDTDRPRVPHGKYEGLDLLDLAYLRSVLNAQLRQPLGLNPRMLEEWQANLKAALDSTTAGTGDELVPTQVASACGWTSIWKRWSLPCFPVSRCPRTPSRFLCRWGTRTGIRAPRTWPPPARL